MNNTDKRSKYKIIIGLNLLILGFYGIFFENVMNNFTIHTSILFIVSILTYIIDLIKRGDKTIAKAFFITTLLFGFLFIAQIIVHLLFCGYTACR